MKSSNKSFVIASDSVPETVVQSGRNTSKQVLISSERAPHFAMRRITIKAGGGLPNHTNEVEHEQFVLIGTGQVGIGDKIFTVKKGDALLIPAGINHWYENSGDEAFSFLCLVPNKPDKITMITD
ncbi:cupin domain-containing protein [Candidatus Latescibacterota bacterium]